MRKKAAMGLSFKDIRTVGPYGVAILFLAIMVLIRVFADSLAPYVDFNVLSVHIVFELVSILVAFAIFTVGWATYQNARHTDILILCAASFATGCLDLFHTLSFTGMPDFFGPSGPNKAIDFWFASRITASLAFMYLAVSPPRKTRLLAVQRVLMGTTMAWVALCFWVTIFHPDWLPEWYSEEYGLTRAKILVEWGLSAIAICAGILLFVGAEKRENMNVRWMACASLIYGMCGYFFSLYRDFQDLFSLCGHVYKAASYMLLYRAVFVECVSRPYARVQQLAAEAEASNLSKSRFLANVSHEFRTPLGVITGFADLLLSSSKLDPQSRHWTETIQRNSKQLSLLIDDLLDLAKAETEKIEIRMARVDVGVLVEQVKQALQMQVRDSVLIRTVNQMNTALVVTDELRLRQILMNIVGNAIKFTAKGFVEVTMRRTNSEHVEILIVDTGIGIDPAEIDRLFQPFSQVSNPNRRHFGGTGLGLSLSRKLAELLGGRLILLWSRPGQGSCFSITLKDHMLPEEALLTQTKAAEEFTTPPSFAGRRVLIAEDSEDNQMLLESYLAPTGIDITFAENGRAAVDAAHKSQFDLILMDIQMPVMDGFEATAELRRFGWGGKIVALTAHALQPERERAMRSGFDNYLVKPIKRETLWRSIEQSIR
jgi:signal transduction histidine kinase